MFGENIEAWAYGPVVPSLYRYYKRFGDGAIGNADNFNLDEIDSDTKTLLDEIFQVYGQYSAWKLANMTHDEPPWKKAIEKGQSTEITDQALTDFFKTLLQ